jgi:hypothetical protein
VRAVFGSSEGAEVATTTVISERRAEAGRRSGESRRQRSQAIARIVAATRAAQGLPPHVEDNAVLELVAAHLEQAVPDEAA